MKNWLTIWPVVAALVLVVAGIMSYLKPQPKLTAMQAGARALDFCRQVGWKADGRPAMETSPGYPRGAWRVEFRDVADKTTFSLEVGGLHGSVLGAQDCAAWDRLVKPVSTRITREQADRAAEKFLHIAGADMGQCRMTYSGIDKPSDNQSPTMWEVRYDRFYKGYEFEQDGAHVDLDPSDGSLVSLGYRCDSELPRNIGGSILEKEAAIKIAANYLKRKRDVNRVMSASLLIAQPSFPEDLRIDGPEPTRSYLCWVVHLIWDQTHEAFVYVDAANGKVRGWTSCM